MRAAVIHTSPDTHLDHLVPLAAEMQLPLILSDSHSLNLVHRYYPAMEATLLDPYDLSLSFIADSFDLIFQTGRFWAVQIVPQIELLTGKRLLVVFCPHGNSDKKYSVDPNNYLVWQQIALLYGDHMRDLLKATGGYAKIAHPIFTGNFRYQFYRKHQLFYDQLFAKMLPSSFDPSLPILLYAPTWDDDENPSSFFDHTLPLIKEVTAEWNVIVKPHPFLKERHPAMAFYIQAECEQTERVFFLDDFPPIYPVLAKSDAYLGDYSSVGYDFLAFDRTMIFLNPGNLDPATCRGAHLHRCGVTASKLKQGEWLAFLRRAHQESSRFASIRQATYRYAFGEERCPLALKKQILTAASQFATSN